MQNCSILAGTKVHIFFSMYQILHSTIKDKKSSNPRASHSLLEDTKHTLLGNLALIRRKEIEVKGDKG